MLIEQFLLHSLTVTYFIILHVLIYFENVYYIIWINISIKTVEAYNPKDYYFEKNPHKEKILPFPTHLSKM